jgi:hypothetical protein
MRPECRINAGAGEWGFFRLVNKKGGGTVPVKLSLAIAFCAATALAAVARAENDFAGGGAPACGQGYYPVWDFEASRWHCERDPVFAPGGS